jgi:GAF domain-containing protein
VSDDTLGQPADARGRRSSTGDEPDRGVGLQLSELARSLQAQPDLHTTLDAIVHAAVANIPGADHAGITRVDRRDQEINSEAATGDVVREVDRLQYRTRQGPCLQAIADQETVRANDLRREARWPAFASGAADMGIGSMLSIQLFVRGEDLGALNLYSHRPDAFDDADEQIGLLLASHAAVAMVGAQQQYHLRTALAFRDLIGQAKGVLMERHGLTAEQAFALLAQASRNNNRTLHDIAIDLVADRPLAPADRGPTT